MLKIVLLILVFITFCGFDISDDGYILKGEVLTNNRSLYSIKEPGIEWIGEIVFSKPYSGIDPGFYGGDPPPSILIDKEIEIGLREDGIVVWRKKDK